MTILTIIDKIKMIIRSISIIIKSDKVGILGVEKGEKKRVDVVEIQLMGMDLIEFVKKTQGSIDFIQQELIVQSAKRILRGSK